MNHSSIPGEFKGLKFSPKFPYQAHNLSFSSKRDFFSGLKRPESEAEDWSPSSAEVANGPSPCSTSFPCPPARERVDVTLTITWRQCHLWAKYSASGFFLFRGFRFENSAYGVSGHRKSDIRKCISGGKKCRIYNAHWRAIQKSVQVCACFGIERKLNKHRTK